MAPRLWHLLLLLLAAFACSAEGAPADGGGAGDGAGTPDDASPGDGSPGDAAAEEDAGLRQDTAAQLEAFFAEHGGRAAFPGSYVDVVEALLRAEDEVTAGDFAAARARVDAIFARYPLSDSVWWAGVNQDGTNVGTPVAYYGLRMLDVIADRGLARPEPPSGALRLTVLLAACANAERPLTPELDTLEEVRLELDPRIEADDHRVVHQSLALFRHYVRALTDGALRLAVAIQRVEGCFDVGFSAAPLVVSRIDRPAEVIEATDEAMRDATDMWWVVYPSGVPSDPVFGRRDFISGGMGGYGRAPLFIGDDLWLLRKPAHLGTGDYSDVERRVYLPQWLQHEFFHHLYRTYPEFGLEETGHQWFDGASWPGDFVGADTAWEPDYYAESVARRLRTATPPMAEALAVARERDDADLRSLGTGDVAGRYRRNPVENGFHEVTLTATDEATLRWENAAGVAWTVLRSDAGRLE
ncbi:MAG: hypothetical protein AAF447_11135, partial [Myxococcota bacterium]